MGSFTLDADAVIPQAADRIGQVAATGIQFRNGVVRAADDSLVNFIKEHTGKMKSLAASDLDFYLTTGRQLLNIGKPFYIEGIGTLIKNKEEGFDFTPGEYMIARLEEPGREGAAHDVPMRDREVRRGSNRQGLLLLLIVAGAGVIGWGGYYLYKRNSFSEPVEKQAIVLPDTTAKTKAQQPADTTAKTAAAAATVTKDSTVSPPAISPPPVTTPPVTASAPTTISTPPAGSIQYRFIILSTDNKHHALRRYNQLLGYQLNIRMDQKDSAWFKLYFPIAALPRDTTYIKDSLSDTYAAPRVIIEQGSK